LASCGSRIGPGVEGLVAGQNETGWRPSGYERVWLQHGSL